MVCQIIGDNGWYVVVYVIEGGIFQVYGMFIVVCGLGLIDQVYQLDEYVELLEFD